MCKRNYISPSLLNSWLYVVNHENADAQEFLDYLERKPKETTEAQQKGLDFEDLVYKGEKPLYNEFVKGGLYQVKVSKEYKDIILLGIIDVLQPNGISDIMTSVFYSNENDEKNANAVLNSNASIAADATTPAGNTTSAVLTYSKICFIRLNSTNGSPPMKSISTPSLSFGTFAKIQSMHFFAVSKDILLCESCF